MTLEIADIGSFHIGGRTVTLAGLPTSMVSMSPGMAPVAKDPNGTFHVEQLYCQYVRLAQPRARHPLLLWHGGGLTGVTWETTPDGRPGWQMYFLRAGHDVYISDAVERGRASFARVPEIWPDPPIFRAPREAWELFRFGPEAHWSDTGARRTPHAGQQFPVAAFDSFMRQAVPRWTGNDAPTQAAYDALVDRIGPCVIVAHSQGCNFAFNAALAAAGKVKAVIALEPSGGPRPDDARIAAARGIPHLFVWGDFLDRHPVWPGNIMRTPHAYHDALRAAGADSTWLSLPEHGIAGNSHMLMMDLNSDVVAGVVQDWLARRRFMV
jgi:pimeloyl-ACP methyl ester carboxylesterase